MYGSKQIKKRINDQTLYGCMSCHFVNQKSDVQN